MMLFKQHSTEVLKIILGLILSHMHLQIEESRRSIAYSVEW